MFASYLSMEVYVTTPGKMPAVKISITVSRVWSGIWDDTTSTSRNCPLDILLTINRRSLLSNKNKKTPFVETTSFLLSIRFLPIFRDHAVCVTSVKFGVEFINKKICPASMS